MSLLDQFEAMIKDWLDLDISAFIMLPATFAEVFKAIDEPKIHKKSEPCDDQLEALEDK